MIELLELSGTAGRGIFEHRAEASGGIKTRAFLRLEGEFFPAGEAFLIGFSESALTGCWGSGILTYNHSRGYVNQARR